MIYSVVKKQRYFTPKTPGFTEVLFWLTFNSKGTILVV